MWRHPHLSGIEEQARIPLFQTNPVEMGMTNQILNERLQARDYYLEAFPAIFAEQKNPFSEENVLAALASYQRSIITVNAPYDLFLQDDQDLSPASQRGLALFKSEKLQCVSCHGGPFFNQPTLPDGGLHETAGFFNTGMYNVDGMGGYPSGAQGLYEITKEASDMGKYRTPSLRNVEKTGPWGHDGSFSTLESVILSYARGGRIVNSGANAGDGSENPWKDPRLQGFSITNDEISDLIAFLHDLTDEPALQNPQYADPFCREKATDLPDCITP